MLAGVADASVAIDSLWSDRISTLLPFNPLFKFTPAGLFMVWSIPASAEGFGSGSSGNEACPVSRASFRPQRMQRSLQHVLQWNLVPGANRTVKPGSGERCGQAQGRGGTGEMRR